MYNKIFTAHTGLMYACLLDFTGLLVPCQPIGLRETNVLQSCGSVIWRIGCLDIHHWVLQGIVRCHAVARLRVVLGLLLLAFSDGLKSISKANNLLGQRA